MGLTPVRVVAVLTHPVQYHAGWFRAIQQTRADVDLHVIYASRPSAEQQGVGFDRAFEWDVPLTEGYHSSTVRLARPGDRFDAARFRGLDVPEIAGAIAAAKPDVVVVFGWYSITLVRAIRAARRLRVPVIYHGDTNLQSAPRGWRRALWIAKTRHLLRWFDAYLAVGVRSAAFLRFFGVGDDRIFPAPPAVDNEQFAAAIALRRSPARAELRRELGIPADTFVVLFAGKLEAKKRPADLVDALGRMTPHPHLAVAGSGPLESALKAAAAAAGVDVTWLGFVNQRAMPRVYAAADCLVLPSDGRETWGLVVNEALASGLPCIVADSVGCAPDLATAETGGSYRSDDPIEIVPALAAAIARVRDAIADGHDFAPACVAAAERSSYTAAADGLARAARAVAGRRATSPSSESFPRVLAPCGAMVIVGGLERMTFEILRTVRSRGAALHCIVNGWANHQIVALADQAGASWSTGYYMHRLTIRVGPIGACRIAADIVRTSAGLLRDARWFRPSHVFVSDYTTVLRNAPALALLRLARIPVILRLGNAPDQALRYRVAWRFVINPLVTRFVCNSAFTERELAAHGVSERKRITIVHTPPLRRSPGAAGDRNPRRLVYVGQIIPEKGLDVLLDAVGVLVARGQDVMLDIAGEVDGWVPPEYEPFRAALLRRTAAPDLRGRVQFLGYREDVPAVLAGAAIHCCPSRRRMREAFGIVVIEAKRAGIPSVVFPSGNLPDLVKHGVDGWVCGDETAEALADGIEHFLDPDSLARGMAAARTSAAAFSRGQFEGAWSRVFAGEI